ncbi:MAG TPA: hypothetical protein VJC06_01585 [Candidatus Paceibacterota bacterium]
MDKMREVGFRTTVLEGLLYLASDRGANPIPSKEDFLISELVSGVCEYITGEEIGDLHPVTLDRHSWTHMVNKYLEALDHQNKFNLSLADAIKHWAQITWQHDHGESWWESQIRYWLMFGSHNKMQFTLEFTIPKSREIEDGLKKIDSDTLRHIENIAEIMKKYINQNREYIKQHYRW